MSHWRRLAFVAVWSLLVSRSVAAQTGQNVLVVANDASATSVRIAEYYAAKRGVPPAQVLKLEMPLTEQVSEADYQRSLEAPLAAWFARTSATDRILYIVLAKDVPIRVDGSTGRAATMASVDSELTLLYRKLTGRPAPRDGRIPNPYFLGASSPREAKRFTHEFYDIFLVTRLDGFTESDVTGIIDRGTNPSREGKFLLDQRDTGNEMGDNWLKMAANRLKDMGLGDRVELDSTTKVLTGESNVLGYYSWGSNDSAIKVRQFGFHFVPGALGAMFVSTDGRTFKEPPTGWKITDWNDTQHFFGGSPQSLAGDLIHEGITGIAAHVAEPYLDATIHPEILFPAYVSGFNLAESFYLAMPFLSWETVVVGDPLCAPFPGPRPSDESLNPPADPISELPRFFSARRVALLTATGSDGSPLNVDGVKYALRADVRLDHADEVGAREALEKAVGLDGRLDMARFQLGVLYERNQNFSRAEEQYRAILAIEPNQPLTLNNLAYLLAVHNGAAAEALPFAQKAYAAAPNVPGIADTLGWVYHLTGDERSAAKYLGEALRLSPNGPEYHLHLAAILVAQGDRSNAEAHLKNALAIAPSLASGAEVKALQDELKKQQK